MAIQMSVAAREAMLQAIETMVGAGRIILCSGTMPAITTSVGVTSLVTITLTADWLTASGTGSMAKNGTLQANADNAGTLTYFRILNASFIPVLQGSIGIAGSGADMIIDAASVVAGQQVTITTLSFTGGNA